MPDDDSGRNGFLSRWARRKTDVSQGRPPEELRPATPAIGAGGLLPEPVIPVPLSASPPQVDAAANARPVLSLEDARALTRDSDFKPFMAQGVGAEVRNAAMKKLFADPHFNVMDGLDTYIDDYSKSDPIPESMLRQMTSAKFLGLFAEEEDDGKQACDALREDANDPDAETVAQSCEAMDGGSLGAVPSESSSQPSRLPPPAGMQASQEDHANTDLRLQPDHAAPAPGAGRGT